MSKSLKALERLGAEKLARGELIRNDSKVEPYINCIKQDLEAYEQLKQDHDKTLINNGELVVKIADLQKENQELKEQLKINEILSNAFEKQAFKVVEENEKLKKAIEILKKHNIKLRYIPDITRPHITLNDNGDGVSLDMEEYDLLKEVLGNE